MIPVVYAAMHFFVDFICAWAMFSTFRLRPDGYFQLLVYNFCAFALQMPFGTLLDLARSRTTGRMRSFLPLVWTGAGVLLTFCGAFTAPWVLGTGNALFHVGGGMDVIAADFSGCRKGRDLGIFVAPGAIGLYLGTVLGTNGFSSAVVFVAAGILTVLFALLYLGKTGADVQPAISASASGRNLHILILGCFAVVILRSLTGFLVSFSWKAEPLLAWVSVFAVASGKMAGGFLSAKLGMKRTICLSLLAACGCFILGQIPFFGLAALFLFNMTMPVTLYLLAENMPETPGFAFGLLTFGLFLGFLPVYGNVTLPFSPGIAGAVGSIVSLVLLLICWKVVQHGRVSS